jgi:imidazolonepropionase-like amidohydrolase
LGLFVRPAAGPGSADGNEMTGPVQSGGRAMDAVYPFDPGIRMANAGGVTTANIMPGSGNVIGGQTIYVKLRGDTLDAMRVQAQGVLGGLKMANGENPKRAYGSKNAAPGTRMKVAALQRAEFIKAREYQAKWDRYRQKLAAAPQAADAPPPEVNLDLEPLVEVLQRKRTVHFHSHRADDILTAVRLADEFGFELVIQHGTESFKIADELAKRRIPVSMTVVDSPGGKAEVVELTERCGAELVKKGVKVIINTDDPVTDSRFLLRTAATAVRGGLTPELALKALTKHAAEALHLDHRLGTLEKGKDADFVVLSGDPFSVYTRVQQTWIDGAKVFDLENDRQRLYQTGGFALPEERRPAKTGPVVDRPALPAFQDAAVNGPKPTASTRSVAVFARRLHTVSQGTIANGMVVVQDGKIAYAGPRDLARVPPNTPVLTVTDVTPGLIDAYSQVPLSGQYNTPADQDQEERSGSNQAELRALDSFNPHEPQLAFLLEQGITVLQACPGRQNVIAGQTGLFRTYGTTAESMTVRFPQAMLFNLGNAVKGAYPGQKPGTRMAVASIIRTALTTAAAYSRKAKSAKEDARPEPSPANEALGLVLDKKVPAIFAAQRADDVLTALRLAKEFNVRPVLALATEGHLILDRLAEAQVPVIAHPTMQGIGDLESLHTFLGNAAALSNRKIPTAISSGMEGYVPKTRVARYEAAIAMVHGLGYQRALKTITLDAAKILDVADRFGSLEAGKEGDLVLYDGDPFEYTTHVQAVFVGGSLAYSRSEKEGVPFARRAMMMSGGEAPCCMGW